MIRIFSICIGFPGIWLKCPAEIGPEPARGKWICGKFSSMCPQAATVHRDHARNATKRMHPMPQDRIELDADDDRIAARTRKLRWVVRASMALSVVMVALVALSQPPIARKMQSILGGGADPRKASGAGATQPDMASLDGVSRAGPFTAPEAGSRPQVSVLPTSRIPVRRGGIATD
jgi:hypothetical protein